MRNVDVATAMKRLALILVASVLAISFAACGDDEGDGVCGSGVSDALKAFPSRLVGEVALTYEGESIALDIDVRSRVSGKDECKLAVTLSQSFNPFCGSVFAGEFAYSTENARWEGDMVQTDAEDGEVPTELDAHYTMTERGDVNAWHKMVVTDKPLCKDRVIEGTISEP